MTDDETPRLSAEELDEIPSWERYLIAIMAISENKDDPEDTLQCSLTRRQLPLVAFGLQLVNRLYPELGGECYAMHKKLIELSAGQEFLDFDSVELPDDDHA